MKLLVFLVAALVIGAVPAYAESIQLDLSDRKNKFDFMYSIECSDSDFIWGTLFAQGNIVRIDKETAETTFYNDPKGNLGAGQDFYGIARAGDGSLFTTDSAFGLLWKFDPESEEWTSAPLMEKIEGVEYPDGYENDPSLIKIGNAMFDSGISAYAGMVFVDGYLYVGLEYSIADVQFVGLAKVDPETLEVEHMPIDGLISPQYLLADGSTLWIADRWNDRILQYGSNAIQLAPESYPVSMAQNESYLFVAVSNGIVQIDKTTLEQKIIEAGTGTFGLSLSDNLLFWTGENQVGTIDLETNLQSIENVQARNNYFACAIDDEWWWSSQGSAVINIEPIVVPEPEPEPQAFEPEPESEALFEDESERDREPPSKKGLGLSIVLSCAYSGENCELVSTIEAEVVDWIKHSNFAKSNREVLLVLEEYLPS